MPSRYDETLDRFVNEYGVPEEEASLFRSNKLREELEEAKKQAAEAAQAKAELESLKAQPKRKEALKQVGIDYDSVPIYGQEVLNQLPADKLDDTEFVASFVQSKGFQAQVQIGDENGSSSGADQIMEFSTSQPGFTGPLKAGVVTPADFASWDTRKQREFMSKHPNAYEALTRGQEAVI